MKRHFGLFLANKKGPGRATTCEKKEEGGRQDHSSSTFQFGFSVCSKISLPPLREKRKKKMLVLGKHGMTNEPTAQDVNNNNGRGQQILRRKRERRREKERERERVRKRKREREMKNG